MKLNAYWVDCTPVWVATHNACGSTIRRAKLAYASEDGDTVRIIGHEHLMALPGFSFVPQPVDIAREPR